MEESFKSVHYARKTGENLFSVKRFGPEHTEKVNAFHASFPEYAPTPLANLKNLAGALGVASIHVKDESWRFGLNAFKVLGGSYAIGSYIAQRLGRDISELPYEVMTGEAVRKELGDLTFVTATDGNHGRGIAWTANRLGQKSVVYMPKGSAAERLAKSVTKELRDLGFLQAKFGVRVAEAEMSAHGCDAVAYMFEPNPGEAARPLAAIASSGEVARVMLALKTVLAAHDETEVLVFDEIDANIGGEVGKAVGEKMRAVAAAHQVLAITHLPQSAVYGDRHFVVSKGVSGGRTRTRISVVEGEDRVSEIARMLGGEKLTSVTRKHAQELLEHGKKKH